MRGHAMKQWLTRFGQHLMFGRKAECSLSSCSFRRGAGHAGPVHSNQGEGGRGGGAQREQPRQPRHTHSKSTHPFTTAQKLTVFDLEGRLRLDGGWADLGLDKFEGMEFLEPGLVGREEADAA